MKHIKTGELIEQGIESIIENDVDMVNDIMKAEVVELDKHAPPSKQMKQIEEI
jgi:hypothetical protein